MNFKGVIVEESLSNKDILNKLKIVSTKILDARENIHLPWHSQLTLHEVEIPEYEAPFLAEQLSKSLRRNFGMPWYADFKNESHHYIVFPFPERTFYIDRKNKEQYEEAKNYFFALGLPENLLSYEG